MPMKVDLGAHVKKVSAFLMIVYGENVFWYSVNHMMLPEVAILSVATTPKSPHSPLLIL